MKKHIRIEPSEIYDQAIVKKAKDGGLTYSYYRLVDCVMEEWGLTEVDREQAKEWVDYNILGLMCNGDGFKVSYATRYIRSHDNS
jgi:hypothetical protein